MKTSKIAYGIDMEYRKTPAFREEIKFRDTHCKHCLNSETNLCEIRRTTDGKLKCIYYEDKKWK